MRYKQFCRRNWIQLYEIKNFQGLFFCIFEIFTENKSTPSFLKLLTSSFFRYTFCQFKKKLYCISLKNKNKNLMTKEKLDQ